MGFGIFDNQASANSCADKISNIMAANIGVGFKFTDKMKLVADLWYAKLAEKNKAGDDELGIVTCGDLGRYPVSVLKEKFGVVGERLHYMGLGVDETPIVPIGQEDAAKSVGHSMTFQRDITLRQEILRYLLQLWTAQRWGAGFPYGTLIINVTGSFILGLFTTLVTERVVASPNWRFLIAVGLLGGYTTFSSFTVEALTLVQTGRWVAGSLYVAGNVLLGLLFAFAGIALARTL